MTIQLHLVYESTDINLQAGGYALLDGFYPHTATDLSTHVTEELDLLIKATDRPAAIQAINQVFTHARLHALDPNPAYIQFAVDGASALWRAVIYDGAVMLDDRMDARWRDGKIRIKVTLERGPAWEGPEAQIPLTNGNGTATLSALNINTCGDNTGTTPNVKNDWVAISGANVAGDIGGPARIELTNTYSNGTIRVSSVWIGQTWQIADFANFAHHLEAENASNIQGLLATVASALGAAGNYANLTVGGNNNTEIFWSLTAAQVGALKGGFYHLMLRFPTSVDWSQIRFFSYLSWLGSGSVPLPQKYHDSGSICDLGTLRLPPYLSGGSGYGGISVYLRLYNNAAAQIVAPLDFVALMPADGWRQIKLSMTYNSRLVDDAILNRAYIDDGAGAGMYGVLGTAGEPIQLYPGRDQRLCFLMDTNNPYPALDVTGAVKIYYRPRRLNL